MVKRPSGKIIAIFFLLLLSGVLIEAAAAVPLAPGLMLHNDLSGDDARYLKRLIRQLDRYAREAKLERSKKNFTVIPGEKKYCGFFGSDRIYLPGDASQWRYDFALRRRVIGVLAAHRFNYRYSAKSSGVAEWIVNGIDAELESAATGGIYLNANRRYPFWSEVAGLTGKLPDFAAMARIGQAKNPGMNLICGETARMLLHIIAKDGKISKVFEQSCSGGKADGFIKLYGSNRKAAQEKLNDEAIRLIWNNFSPIPGEELLRHLHALDKRFIPKTDNKNQPTNNYISCTWQEFAERMKSPRPDAAKLKGDAASEIIKLGRLTTNEEQNLCNIMAKNITEFGKDGAWENFSSNYEKLEEMIRKRIKIDIFMKKTLAEKASLPDQFRILFKMLDNPNPACFPTEKQFMHRTLNDYLR